jgi:dihydrofolate synthase/folylpolyglutamate synthase
MTYKETLQWLYDQLPMYQRIGQAAYKANLDNTDALLEAIGHPERKFKAIHIAGTNGKGSVSHLLASILQEAGYKTGLYTSPHLKDFRERIKINGEMISEAQVVNFIDQFQPIFGHIQSSFFEMTVAMAYHHFAHEKVDFVVLETGMGGRLDSTNRCNPVLTVITNIGFDHTQFLGDTLEKIAFEKAGIIKLGIPVVVGKRQPQTDDVFKQKAMQSGSELYFAEDRVDLRKMQTADAFKQTCDIWIENQLFLDSVDLPLLGNYQIENMVTVSQSLAVLRKQEILAADLKQIRAGIENVIVNTGLQGRWQILHKNPLTIADTAHNSDGIKMVVGQLATLRYEKLHMVFGMVNDKDAFAILQLLPKHATYYFCKPDIPRGHDENQLQEEAFKAGLNGKSYHSVRQAYNAAMNNAGGNDVVYVGGSTFVVAEVV